MPDVHSNNGIDAYNRSPQGPDRGKEVSAQAQFEARLKVFGDRQKAYGANLDKVRNRVEITKAKLQNKVDSFPDGPQKAFYQGWLNKITTGYSQFEAKREHIWSLCFCFCIHGSSIPIISTSPQEHFSQKFYPFLITLWITFRFQLNFLFLNHRMVLDAPQYL